MPALADVNLLLAIVTDRHPYHASAVEWLDGKRTGEVRICRLAQLGLLRLLNNPAVMQEDVLDTESCWAVWHELLEDVVYHFVCTEPVGIDAVFVRFTTSQRYTPHLWNDAYLAAYACAAGLTLVTFDRGFSRFPGLEPEILRA